MDGAWVASPACVKNVVGGEGNTPSDLVRFAMAMGSGGRLKRYNIELLHTSQRLTSGEATGYGLG